MNLKYRIQNFYKRWNIEYNEEERLAHVKERILLTLQEIVKPIFDKSQSQDLLMAYFKLVGRYVKTSELWGGGKVMLVATSSWMRLNSSCTQQI